MNIERDLMKKVEIAQSGYGGVSQDGTIVDRREFPDAVPIQRNGMFGSPEPKPFFDRPFEVYIPGTKDHPQRHVETITVQVYIEDDEEWVTLHSRNRIDEIQRKHTEDQPNPPTEKEGEG